MARGVSLWCLPALQAKTYEQIDGRCSSSFSLLDAVLVLRCISGCAILWTIIRLRQEWPTSMPFSETFRYESESLWTGTNHELRCVSSAAHAVRWGTGGALHHSGIHQSDLEETKRKIEQARTYR